jgi:S1-C subfamily serine protease
VIALVPALLVLAGCSLGTESARRSSAPRPDSPCSPVGDQAPAKALLQCGEQSVAFVETPYATGTGVVVEHVDELYVLTNLHVVDPYSSADVTVGGLEDIGRLPVVGADVAADIALLGPVDDPGEDVVPLPVGDPTVEKGDDVFLVGFPGTSDVREADLTITSGLASRTRVVDAWEQTYIQSDAVIGHGQSGGPLFAATGDLIGISGLSFDDGFALVLSVQDVRAAMARILAGDGDPVLQVPQSADEPDEVSPGATAGTIVFPDDQQSPVLHLPPSDHDRTWNFAVTGPEGAVAVDITDALTGETVAMTAATFADELQDMVDDAVEFGEDPTTVLEEFGFELDAEAAAREIAPGSFSFEVPAEQALDIRLGIAPEALPAELRWTSDLPLWPLAEQVAVGTLTFGEPTDGVLGSFQYGAAYRIELTAGQRVEVSASSPQGDVSVSITPPGHDAAAEAADEDEYDEDYGEEGIGDDGSAWFDDSDEGLYGLDVLEEFTAGAAGTYDIWIENYETSPIAFRLEIREPPG